MRQELDELDKLANKFTSQTIPAPIKVVEKAFLRQCHATVIKGEGRVTATTAAPYLKNKQGVVQQPHNKIWRVLFDSGSDGDIVFIPKSKKYMLNTQEKLNPQRWQTSIGVFKTEEVASVDLTFPEYNETKRMHIQPDVKYVEEDKRLTYDLIIGIETMMEWRCALDFEAKTLAIDGCT